MGCEKDKMSSELPNKVFNKSWLGKDNGRNSVADVHVDADNNKKISRGGDTNSNDVNSGDNRRTTSNTNTNQNKNKKQSKMLAAKTFENKTINANRTNSTS